MLNQKIHYIYELYKLLVKPLVDADPKTIQDAKILASISLGVMGFTCIGIVLFLPNYSTQQILSLLPILLGVSLFIIPYYCARHGQILRTVLMLTLIALLLISLAISIIGDTQIGLEILYYYMIVIVFASVYLSKRSTLIIVSLALIINLLFAFTNEDISFFQVICGPVAFSTFASGFVIIFINLWKHREIEHRKLLQESEHRKAIVLAQQKQFDILQNFIKAMTHDFGNRLSSIETTRYIVGQMIERDYPKDTTIERLNRCSLQIQMMSDEFEKLRLITKLHINPNLQKETKTDVNSVILMLMNELKQIANQYSVTIQLELDPFLPLASIRPSYLQEILVQLTINAIIYSASNSEIIIKTCYDNQHIRLIVLDNGIGISEEHISSIFEPFYKVAEARTVSEHSGVGIGLTIAKLLTEMCEGYIKAESKLGQGSKFTVGFLRFALSQENIE